MGRRSARAAREAREAWARGFAGSPPVARAAPTPTDRDGRGVDYSDAPDQWVCNRKKAYPDQLMARRAATLLNDQNQTRKARPGYFGVVVNEYQCRRCGRWHLGR